MYNLYFKKEAEEDRRGWMSMSVFLLINQCDDHKQVQIKSTQAASSQWLSLVSFGLPVMLTASQFGTPTTK
jgi:hypothetical protein